MRQAESTVRLEWYYRSKHLACSTTTHVLIGDVPTIDDCRRLAVQGAIWDLDGRTPGTVYRLFRSGLTELVYVAARSMDRRSRAVYVLQGFGGAAFGAEVVSDPLGWPMAVLMRLDCLPNQLRRHGWMYLPGICHNVVRDDDPTMVNDAARGPLELSVNGMIGLLGPDVGAVVVALTCQRQNVKLTPCQPSVVYQASLGVGQLGTQRRRLVRMPNLA